MREDSKDEIVSDQQGFSDDEIRVIKLIRNYNKEDDPKYLSEAHQKGIFFLKEMAKHKDEDKDLIKENQRLASQLLYFAANNGNLASDSLLYGCLVMQVICNPDHLAGIDPSSRIEKENYIASEKSKAETETNYFEPIRKQLPKKLYIDDLYDLATALSNPKCKKKNDTAEDLAFFILRYYIEFTDNTEQKKQAIIHLKQIGFRYLTGSNSRNKNEAKAANYCYVAAKEGSGDASFYYAYLLHPKKTKSQFDTNLNEMSTPKEYEAAATAYYEKIRKTGTPIHSGYLAMMYYFGWGGPAMPEEAITNFETASTEQQHAPSEYMLAKIYFEQCKELNTPENSKAALEYYKKAMEHHYEPTEETRLFLKDLDPQNWLDHLSDDINIIASIAATENANAQLVDLIGKLPFSELTLQQMHHKASPSPSTPCELNHLYDVVRAAASENVNKANVLEQLVAGNENRLFAAYFLAKRLEDFFAQTQKNNPNNANIYPIYTRAKQVLEKIINISFKKRTYSELPQSISDLPTELPCDEKIDAEKCGMEVKIEKTITDPPGFAQLFKEYTWNHQTLENATTALRAFEALKTWLNLSSLPESETSAWLNQCVTTRPADEKIETHMETVRETIEKTLDSLRRQPQPYKYKLLVELIKDIGQVAEQAKVKSNGFFDTQHLPPKPSVTFAIDPAGLDYPNAETTDEKAAFEDSLQPQYNPR